MIKNILLTLLGILIGLSLSTADLYQTAIVSLKYGHCERVCHARYGKCHNPRDSKSRYSLFVLKSVNARCEEPNN